MYNTQRMLLALLLYVFSSALYAQINVTIEINGVNKAEEENIRLLLSIQQQKDHLLMTEGRLLRLHKKAPEEIRKALQPYGYYRPVIESTLDPVSPEEWHIRYDIDPGPPLLVAEFKFTLIGEIRDDEKFQTFIKDPPLRKGDIFNHVVYEDFKSSLAKLASIRGYFGARFIEHRVEIDLDTYEARIELSYEGVARYHFGEVKLEQDVIEPELLRRYIPFERGDPYTLDQLIELQQALNDSDYFQTVEVSPGEPQPGTNEIPITVKLTPRKRHRFSIGLGYGTDTGARAKFGWEVPRVNSHGHRFDTTTQVSEIGYRVVANYRIPVLNPRTDQLIFTTGIVNETTDTSESTLRTIGASLKHRRGEWREVISLNYQKEVYTIAEDSGDSNLLIPGISWSRTWGNNFIYAIDGLRFDLDLRGASNQVVSDADFFQAQSNLKFISPLGQQNRMITRGTIGSTWTSDFDILPTSVRFFTGGAQSVRGYAYQSLGPVDDNGDVTGGKYLVVGSIEFEHSFKNKWGIAAFYDVGNAVNDLSDDLKKGTGIGVRWKSPVGPVRIDLASAISLEGNPWRIHISIGPDL
jgi:translocation and assembly module TamA